MCTHPPGAVAVERQCRAGVLDHLAAAVVGLGVWAFNAQSDADDAQAKLASQEQAAAAATPAPTVEPAPAAVDPAAQGAQLRQG